MLKNKIFYFLFFLILVTYASLVSSADKKDAKYVFKITVFDGEEYVDLREISEKLRSFDVLFSSRTFAVSILYLKNSLHTEIGKKYYILNGKQFIAKNPFKYQSGKIYAPIDVLEEVFGAFELPLDYLKKNQNLTIQKKNITETEKINQREVKNKKPKLDLIILDAGHGGHDPGALGFKKIAEKKVTLLISSYLKKKFEEELKVKVVMTRSDDRFLSLQRRVNIANSFYKKGMTAVFISIHGNSTITRSTDGYEIYYLSQNPSNEEARRLAIRENNHSSDQKYVKILESFLISASIQAESKTLAKELDESVMTALGRLVTSRGVKRADFAVLRGALMPAVLFEVGYLTNREESQVLISEAFRRKLADGMVNALQNYIKRVNAK